MCYINIHIWNPSSYLQSHKWSGSIICHHIITLTLTLLPSKLFLAHEIQNFWVSAICKLEPAPSAIQFLSQYRWPPTFQNRFETYLYDKTSVYYIVLKLWQHVNKTFGLGSSQSVIFTARYLSGVSWTSGGKQSDQKNLSMKRVLPWRSICVPAPRTVWKWLGAADATYSWVQTRVSVFIPDS